MVEDIIMPLGRRLERCRLHPQLASACCLRVRGLYCGPGLQKSKPGSNCSVWSPAQNGRSCLEQFT